MSNSVLVKKQVKVFGPVVIGNGSKEQITATVRYDDQCGNGHNTFSITGETTDGSGGCIHDEIARCFPELAPYIKWHLCSSDGPMHYIANTVYHAGDRDYKGLRKGESRQLGNGKTKLLSWKLAVVDADGNEVKSPEQYVRSAQRPECDLRMAYVPWLIHGEGKERDLDAARRCAVWPDATDEELTSPGLEDRLRDRLPALIAEFRQAVESLGFVF